MNRIRLVLSSSNKCPCLCRYNTSQLWEWIWGPFLKIFYVVLHWIVGPLTSKHLITWYVSLICNVFHWMKRCRHYPYQMLPFFPVPHLVNNFISLSSNQSSCLRHQTFSIHLSVCSFGIQVIVYQWPTLVAYRFSFTILQGCDHIYTKRRMRNHPPLHRQLLPKTAQCKLCVNSNTAKVAASLPRQLW